LKEVILGYKIALFWNVPSPILIEIYQRFGGTYCFHLQRRRLDLTDCITVDRVRIYHLHSKTAAVNL